jgi:xanthine dehydrogenase small subunit
MAETIRRAKKTEKFFSGKKWDRQIVEKACLALESEFKPITDARASAEGRIIAAKNLLLKFWYDTANSNRKPV